MKLSLLLLLFQRSQRTSHSVKLNYFFTVINLVNSEHPFLLGRISMVVRNSVHSNLIAPFLYWTLKYKALPKSLHRQFYRLSTARQWKPTEEIASISSKKGSCKNSRWHKRLIWLFILAQGRRWFWGVQWVLITETQQFSDIQWMKNERIKIQNK